MDYHKLQQIAYQTLADLACDEGINASSKNEAFGCVFGRDSAITILKLLRAYQRRPDTKLLEISRQALLSLVSLQGKEANPESGEQPGKFIHEFRKDHFEHLLKTKRPWFVYPDNMIRNYDSLDSTPLGLIALYRYWEITKDEKFLITVLPAVEAGLNWIITFADIDKDRLIEYPLPERHHGGLVVQSWADSHESMRQANGQLPKYPIAPAEVQGFAWLALKLWADYYLDRFPTFGKKILSFAHGMKRQFNRQFILKDKDLWYVAQALDGDKYQIKTVTGHPLMLLWATYRKKDISESIIYQKYISDIVKRAFQTDLFESDAGIRTMSTLSPTFNPQPDSYHNGSFWPMLNGLIVEGLENFAFFQEADQLRQASLQPIHHFGYPIELYVKFGNYYTEYCSPSGQLGCHHQAWSAAAILDLTIDRE